MRKPAQTIGVLAITFVIAGAGSALAQEATLNRVVAGDFENVVVSLSLPPDAAFPMFSGGWASRGRRAPDILEGAAFEGVRSVRIVTRPQDGLQLIQDLPINSTAFGLRFAFLIEDGSQRVRLMGNWDRRDAENGDAVFEAVISATGIVFTTPAGSWRINGDVSPYQWHSLMVIADPRHGTQNVWLDGRSVMSLPGVSDQRPSTIIIGGDADDSGSFRYDAVEVLSLVDVEMATIRRDIQSLETPARPGVLARLSAAASALDRGAAPLALLELGVARNMLGNASLADQTLRAAIAELIDLIEISAKAGEDLEIAQYFFSD